MRKFIVVMFLIVFLLGACVAYAQVDETAVPETTHHLLLENTDDAWILCADGNFVVEVNGHDSIHVICQPQGGESK